MPIPAFPLYHSAPDNAIPWKSKSITGRDFMRRMGLSANTFYRRVRAYKAEHGIAEPISA